MSAPTKNSPEFQDALQGLRRGDFSRLEPLFDGGEQSRLVEWHRIGLFDDEPGALAEALSCACFLGKSPVVEYLLDRGVDPLAGTGTGMNALHWAVNRGQLDTTHMLIQRRTPLETKNNYGGTVLGTAVWSAIHEPKADHLAIIDALIRAGANLDAVDYPTGYEPLDGLLRKRGLGA
jgi:Ankyrin repeats (3 copies)